MLRKCFFRLSAIVGIRQRDHGVHSRLVQRSLERYLGAVVCHRHRFWFWETELPDHVLLAGDEGVLASFRSRSVRVCALRLLGEVRSAVAVQPSPLPVRADGLSGLRRVRHRGGEGAGADQPTSLHLAGLSAHPPLLHLQLRLLRRSAGRGQSRWGRVPWTALALPVLLLVRVSVCLVCATHV